MPFVPGYRHDVFVSYAHVDNEPVGADKGWVTTFVRNLETFLRRKLGQHATDASVWMDYELTGNQPFAGSIEEALRSSATLLVVVSPGYLGSAWCGREREAFGAAVRDRVAAGSRIFRVESDEVELADLPSSFRETLGYKFWVRDRDQRAARTLGLPTPIPSDPNGRLYFDRLLDLAQDLADVLKRLRAEAQTALPGPLTPEAGAMRAPSPASPAILLAETTDDLDPQREELRRYVIQAGVQVLPESFYPRDSVESFRDQLRADLTRAALFVQLLSEVSGRKPEGVAAGFPGVQYDEACAASVEAMRWRPGGLPLERIAQREPAYARLLTGADVRECGFEEFKKAVVDRVTRPAPAPPRPAAANGFQIFVNADLADREDAARLCRFLDQEGEYWIQPNHDADPARGRRSLEAALAACDALLLLYGRTDPDWVTAQIIQARRALSARDAPVGGMAIVELPPEAKDAVAGTSLRGVRRLDCRHGLDPAVMRQFLSELRPPP
jgi:hypothetical protein